MNCTNCGQPLDEGAAFCGNCGQPVAGTVPAPAPAAQALIAPAFGYAAQPVQPASTQPLPPFPEQIQNSEAAPVAVQPTMAIAAGVPIPAYAVPVPGHHVGETKATLSIVFGVLSLIASLFIVIIGLALGVAGVVLATMSRRSTKRLLSTIGLVISIIAIIASLAIWALLIKHNTTADKKLSTAPTSSNSTAHDTSVVSTPCYGISFGSALNIENASGSCDLQAYNGATLDTSTDAYKVYASSLPQITAANFDALAKKAIEQDIASSLPSFSITNEASQTFDGSPSYVVTTNNGAGIAVVEAAVYHPVGTENFFVFVHAAEGSTTSLTQLASDWEWAQ